MANNDKRPARELIGKTVVSKTGRKFGEVADLIFEVKSGELISIVLKNTTPYVEKLELEKDKQDNYLVPWRAVIASGDFLVVSEEDII